MKKPPPAEPRKITLPTPEDRAFLLPLGGSAWTEIGLPSGGVVAPVDGHVWRIVVERVESMAPMVWLTLEKRK